MPDDGPKPADPAPLVEVAVEPKEPARREALRAVLKRMAAEDGKLSVKTDEELGQIIVGGGGELYLDVIMDRLKREVPVNVGAPQVAYRETISRTVEREYTHKRQGGKRGEFVRIKFRVAPARRDDGFTFLATGDSSGLPAVYAEAVQRGVRGVLGAGPLIGFPVIDVTFTLLDGAWHDKESSAAAFEAAGRAGFIEAIQNAGPKILEPVMAVEVAVPWDCAAETVADLEKRRGRVHGSEGRGATYLISLLVPFSNMLGYVNSLRAISRGRGRFAMIFDHYAAVPAPVEPGDGPLGGAMAMRA